MTGKPTKIQFPSSTRCRCATGELPSCVPEKLEEEEFLGLNSFGKSAAAAAAAGQVGDLRKETLTRNWKGNNPRENVEQVDGNAKRGRKESKDRQGVELEVSKRGRRLKRESVGEKSREVDGKRRGKHVYIITNHHQASPIPPISPISPIERGEESMFISSPSITNRH